MSVSVLLCMEDVKMRSAVVLSCDARIPIIAVINSCERMRVLINTALKTGSTFEVAEALIYFIKQSVLTAEQHDTSTNAHKLMIVIA